MNLTLDENREINKLISNLQPEDYEKINKEVEYIICARKFNPVCSAIIDYCKGDYTKDACEYLSEENIEYIDMAENATWELLIMRVTREYAINIWRKRDDVDAYEEVA